MKKVVLISCVSKKLSRKAKAQELYISPLFVGNLRYARSMKPDAIFILSAKYGLVALDEEIGPYDVTLNSMSSDEVKAWAEGVLSQLTKRTDLRKDHFVFLAGVKYRKYLLPHLASFAIPMQGLGIGKQLKFLAAHAKESHS